MYPVPQYLRMLKLAKRAPRTIRTYNGVLDRFARFVGVPLDELHNHLLPEHIINYADSLEGKSSRGTRHTLSVIHRYYAVNGVAFGELEKAVLKPTMTQDHEDKPLDIKMLQAMMDLGDVHAKAIIITMISTGMRPGECSQIQMSDLDGDTITIKNEYAKRGHGGKVYLTSEAQEYLAAWLRERDAYKARAMKKTYTKKDSDDQRLFCASYTVLHKIFKLLYVKIDGERGKYRDRCTIHSCRKYFRTHAVSQVFTLDMVEHVMRHEGYLTSSYLRLDDDAVRRAFHETEDQLYITRADRRHADGQVMVLQDKITRLEARLDLLDKVKKKASKESEGV